MGGNAADEVTRIVAEAKAAAIDAIQKATKKVEDAEKALDRAKNERVAACKAGSNILNTKDLAELAKVSAGTVAGWMREPDSEDAEPPEFPGEPDAETAPLIDETVARETAAAE